MAVVVVHRPARLEVPSVRDGVFPIADPPRIDANAGSQGFAQMLMPVMAGAGSLLVALTNLHRPLFLAIGLIFFVSSVALGVIMFVNQRSGVRRRVRTERERYLCYLDELRDVLRSARAEQLRAAEWSHPEPAALLSVVRLPQRRWERRLDDGDFLLVRAGSGVVGARLRALLELTDNPLIVYDTVAVTAARGIADDHAELPGLPVAVDLRRGVTSVVGPPAAAQDLARALLCQVVAWHAPGEVGVAVVRADAVAARWDWVKWLPHVRGGNGDGEGELRVAASVGELTEQLSGELERRAGQRRKSRGDLTGSRLVVLVDGDRLPPHAGLASPDPSYNLTQLGVYVIYLVPDRRTEPSHVDQRITIGLDGCVLFDGAQAGPAFTGDRIGVAEARTLARALSPLRLEDERSATLTTEVVDLAQILGVADPGMLDPAQTWANLGERDVLRVPVGVGTHGRAVIVDLKESALGGMGPHGLAVGATGSGKSELLRTLVTALAVRHHPDRLAMVLVDFKGGATFAGMSALPHLAGMITNLADDLSLVDRMRDAIYGEMQRRQEVLKAAGNLPNVVTYQRLRTTTRTDLPPLPHLLIIIDEFSELLTARQDFAELFVAVGRIGRSIGLHLLLATQRLELGKIRGLETHLSYRIALRTFSESESREALGTPDAYLLPPEPGVGFLKVDTTVYERFKAALVSAPYRQARQQPRAAAKAKPFTTLPDSDAWLPPLPAAAVAGPTGAGPAPAGATPWSTGLPEVEGADAVPTEDASATVLDIVVRRLADTGLSVHKVWLPPLPTVVTLDAVLDLAAVIRPPQVGRPSAVVGLIDEPTLQLQRPYVLDFTAGDGNVLVVGSTQAGKSMLIRALVLSTAHRHPPTDAAFYCIDYGGGGLAGLRDLPHVGGVATRADRELVRRTVMEALSLIDRREAEFQRHGFDSADAWRRWRIEQHSGERGDVFLVIDGWGALRQDLEDLEPLVAEVAARGLAYGVHVILASSTPHDLRPRTQSAFGSRIELRLNDAFDSQSNRMLMATISAETPGRGIAAGGLLFHGAVPRLDGVAELADVATAQREAVRKVDARWSLPPVPPIRTLPLEVPVHALPADGVKPPAVAIGIGDLDLGPASVNLFGPDPHLLVFGDSESGKTNTLRVVAGALIAAHRPDDLAIVVVDYRHGLLGVVPQEYQLAYCAARPHTERVAADLARELAKRLPPPDATPQQLASRAWWKGPQIVVVIDDYDLVVTSSGNPLTPLLELVPQGRDIGLHLVVARRSGGAGRAMFDPLIQRLGDLGTPGLLHSGDRAEGKLVCGIAPQRLPTGRAVYATRTRPPLQVQVALSPSPR
jgi:S-DNA-T family DNA segregation ATPase FtsK/SpoIIIE